MNDDWRPIPGYEGRYDITSDGRVRSYLCSPTPQPMRHGVDRKGYSYVPLSLSGTQRKEKIHRLVLLAFVGPPPGPEYQGCHNDGDKSNNHVSNLRWDTQSGNARDMVLHGVHNMARKTHCLVGHEFTEANTYTQSNGGRKCRACTRIRQREHEARRRMAS